ncbi:MAG: histidine phosphatase family protein [Neisseriaceae bacterium]|nr:MAG: histidine phosphatase family protein [Neisseriaceae bacterium]
MILIRHAQSEFNAKLTNHHNSSLTKLGIEQANKTALFLEVYLDEIRKNQQKHYSKIITSPLKRTFETSLHIAAYNGLEIKPNNLILEHQIEKNGFKIDDWHEINSKLKVKGHEDDQSVIERLKLFWEKYKDENCIVVSHGTPIDILIRFAKNENVQYCPEWDGTIKNCCITDTNDLDNLYKSTDHLN